jgi:two-component system, sensor histidine kinase and response regulator
MIVLNLIQNVALLVALAATYQVIRSRFEKNNVGYQILSGLLFGGAGIVGMITPINFAPGIIFDGRSIILSVSGLFGGPLVAAIAASMCATYRLWLGGGGAWVGVSVILESASLGVVFYFLWRNAETQIGTFSLWSFGLLVNAIMLGLFLALPGGTGPQVLQQMGLTILILYPVATTLICRIFLDYEKQAQDRKALQTREERYRGVFQNAAVGIDVVDANGRFLEINRALAHMLGYSKRELLNMTILDITHPDDVEVSRIKHDQMVRRDSKSYRLEKRYVRKDRETLWADLSVSAVRGADGAYRETIGVITDLTERKRAEEALRVSEARYRSLFANISNAVAVYKAEQNGEDFIVADFNAAAERIERIDKKEVIGRSVLKVFPGVRDVGLLEVFQRVWRTGEAESHPAALYKDERIEGWRENFVYKLPTGEIVAVYSDETERKKAEDALRESEQRYRRIVDTANEGVWAIDREFKTIFVNRRMADMLGYSREEMLGRTVDSFMFDEDLMDHRKNMELRRHGENQSYERRFRRKDRGTLWTIVSATALKDSMGNFAGSFAMVADVTERKRAEEALKQRMGQLERFNRAMVDRELRMIELKKQINGLLQKAGEPEKFRIVE